MESEPHTPSKQIQRAKWRIASPPHSATSSAFKSLPTGSDFVTPPSKTSSSRAQQSIRQKIQASLKKQKEEQFGARSSIPPTPMTSTTFFSAVEMTEQDLCYVGDDDSYDQTSHNLKDFDEINVDNDEIEIPDLEQDMNEVDIASGDVEMEPQESKSDFLCDNEDFFSLQRCRDLLADSENIRFRTDRLFNQLTIGKNVNSG